MYLSKLEIIGFKSFAQKVNLAFDSGISAIVGPNGCGKTNIVDAIRWVLGEQRYSALRSEKMEDVIFNGTKNRKPLGMAEASLIIENNKGILPSEYTQVTVGRRVYRSGESEYLLNKVPCRLKDILDLFMDTGMGADAYSVIELKMIETILSDKTDERRRLFEEAAGVTKYKHRRKAAYRKLEAVQADLVRVNDIVAEVQKAVNSLERQARKAEQYNELKVKLRAFEMDLMEREYAQLVGRIAPMEENLAQMTSSRDKIDIDLAQEESRFEELRSSMNDVEKRLAEAQRDVSQHMEKVNRIEQKNLVADERIKSLTNNIGRYEQEKKELTLEQIRLGELIVMLDRQIASLREEREKIEAERVTARGDLQNATTQLDAKKAELAALNEKNLQLVQVVAEKQSQQDKLRGRAENLHGRQSRAQEEITSYEEELLRLAQEIDEYSVQDKKLRREFAEAEMKYYDAEKQKKDLLQRVEVLQREEMDILGEIQRRKSRIDFLKGLIESREGFSESVRFLASTQKWKIASRHLTVADAIHAEERYSAAIEAALGEFASLMIVESREDAEHGIALLKEEQKGKATFVSMDSVPVVQSNYAAPRIHGVVGWAIDLAQFESKYEPLFRFLFDRVLVVEDTVAAKSVASQCTGIRCVSIDGEVSTSIGVVRGGSKRVDEGGIIGKQNQIENLEREAADFENTFESLKAQRLEVSGQHDAILLKEFSDDVKSLEKEMNSIEMRMAQLEFERKRANDVIEKNKEEITSLLQELQELEASIEAASPELDQLREEKSAIERSLGAATQELESIEVAYNECSTRVKEVEIRAVQLHGELQNTENELQRSNESISTIITTLDKRDVDVRAAREEIDVARSTVDENAEALATLTEELGVLESRRAAVEQENLHVREEMHRIQMKIKDERRTHDDTLKHVHELELKIVDLKNKVEHLKERAFTEFELQLELKQYPDDEFVDFAALRDEIQHFRDKIKSLGNINFAAFEEYSEEKQRHEFLTTQRNDLIEAEKTLLATIEEINTTAQNKFMETFEKIRLNFI
ncbi:MAG: chromosome segregation protein SMC, partial [Ignavibacteriae bacterium]|nr:chromosome segregation protein SMC [Ignavibacteriota bacterium]